MAGVISGRRSCRLSNKYTVPAAVQIFGPYPGRLQGGGETLSLQRPDVPDLDTNTGAIFIPSLMSMSYGTTTNLRGRRTRTDWARPLNA
jgi:hypothetical protein